MPAKTAALRLPVSAMSPPPTKVNVSSWAEACDRVFEARAAAVFDEGSFMARPIAIAIPPTKQRSRVVQRTRVERRLIAAGPYGTALKASTYGRYEEVPREAE
jgi:hypothetical protein